MVRRLSPEKREKFLTAALELFVAKGVQNTTTADIARQAGTAAGTLFLYFPTKQHLINELVLRIGRQQSETIHSMLDSSMNARDIFHAIWTGSLRWFLDHLPAYRYIQQVRDSNVIPEEVIQESAQFFDYYYLAIQKGLEEGVLRPLPPELIGAFLYQDVVAVMNLLPAIPDPARREEIIQAGFEIFWSGVSREQP